MAESTLTEAPRVVAVPAASMTVYEFEVSEAHAPNIYEVEVK